MSTHLIQQGSAETRYTAISKQGRRILMLGFKAILLGLIVAMILVLPSVDDADVRDTAFYLDEAALAQIDVTSGVRAALYAFVGAATLFVGMIKIRQSDWRGDFVNFLPHVIGAWAALYVAWYWLRDATGDNPWPYAIHLAVLALFAVVGIFTPLLTAKLLGGRSQQGNNSGDTDKGGDE